ncbi:acetate--CoA ligase family protein [archaeon]|jgi:hypothetical protein|nr:acetate--CoA ligase family protein [archaeon]MBT4351297.1 acetate--CoA ligase family protein [archaeon]MBT4646857.1 acetate--CoA ligase family protein [archaeon]MBT6822102.1 acetate--CoA ligase family protein [archaeon]MBT7392591.1 acetate--CoA ligase family protein [archaeon]
MLLSQEKTEKILKKYSFNIPKQFIVKDKISTCRLKFPVALKIDSKDIIHKTDIGLVFIGLNSIKEVNEKIIESKKILKKKNVLEYNFLLQEMIKGTEIIMGMKRDETFGPVIIFGLGGVMVEIIKDISMRIAPLNKSDCLEMIDELKGKKLIEGYRSYPKLDKNKISQALINLSKLSLNEKNIIEIDFNPVIADEKRCCVVDARIIREEKKC